MKKICTITLMLMVAMLAMTSCEPNPDADLAYDIEGVWQGSITGNYYSHRYRTNDFDTEMKFYRIDAYGGDGYEIDYNYRTNRYYRNNFDWTVRNNRIYLEYDDGSTIIIRDYDVYSMRGDLRFRGYFDDYRTGEELASFNLIKVLDPNKYYYNYTRGNAPADSVTAVTEK